MLQVHVPPTSIMANWSPDKAAPSSEALILAPLYIKSGPTFARMLVGGAIYYFDKCMYISAILYILRSAYILIVLSSVSLFIYM